MLAAGVPPWREFLGEPHGGDARISFQSRRAWRRAKGSPEERQDRRLLGAAQESFKFIAAGTRLPGRTASTDLGGDTGPDHRTPRNVVYLELRSADSRKR